MKQHVLIERHFQNVLAFLDRFHRHLLEDSDPIVYFTTTFYTKMKYVLVLWVETNETSVMEEHAVRDTNMLSNFGKRGMVYHKEIGKKAPKGGWKAYLAQVVSIHGKYLPIKICLLNLNMDTKMPHRQMIKCVLTGFINKHCLTIKT